MARVRGGTIYNIEIPDRVEVIDVPHPTTPHVVFRTNKKDFTTLMTTIMESNAKM